MRSPFLTCISPRVPSSSTLPVPTAMIVPRVGLSLGASGMEMPPSRFSCDSSRSTTTLSPSGWSVTLDCDFGLDLVAVAAIRIPPERFECSVCRRYQRWAVYGELASRLGAEDGPARLQTAVEPLIWA